MSEFYLFLGIVVPAVTAIIVALIKTRRHPNPRTQPLTPVERLQDEVKELKTEIERQHIKIDDISERLAWLEGKVD